MLKSLPTWIFPKRLALARDNLKGHVALAQMERLHDSLCDVQGDAHIDWSFAMDDKQRPTISGSVHAQLPMLCQRCLQPMLWPVDKRVALVILTHEPTENEELPAGYEANTLINTPNSLITLIEDELILALPIVAIHSICPSNEYQLQETLAEDLTFQNNPFYVLSKLKNN
ncbi:MAG: hypothetical protein DRR19_09475 [Candidatus Parabeggiatoa sp. nov. 1]|nr:MAG: hypothetical protein DRR19_09475 [Gammaproteobacteria bacterium]